MALWPVIILYNFHWKLHIRISSEICYWNFVKRLYMEPPILRQRYVEKPNMQIYFIIPSGQVVMVYRPHHPDNLVWWMDKHCCSHFKAQKFKDWIPEALKIINLKLLGSVLILDIEYVCVLIIIWLHKDCLLNFCIINFSIFKRQLGTYIWAIYEIFHSMRYIIWPTEYEFEGCVKTLIKFSELVAGNTEYLHFISP